MHWFPKTDLVLLLLLRYVEVEKEILRLEDWFISLGFWELFLLSLSPTRCWRIAWSLVCFPWQSNRERRWCVSADKIVAGGRRTKGYPVEGIVEFEFPSSVSEFCFVRHAIRETENEGSSWSQSWKSNHQFSFWFTSSPFLPHNPLVFRDRWNQTHDDLSIYEKL